MKVPRKIPKRLSDVVLDLFNPEVGSNSVGRWWFKILKSILSDVPDVGRIPKSSTRGVVGNNDPHLSTRAANSIDLFHEQDEVSNMLDCVAQIDDVDRAGFQRQRTLKITHHVDSGKPLAIQSESTVKFLGSAAKINNDGFQSNRRQASTKYSALLSQVWYLRRCSRPSRAIASRSASSRR